MFRFSALHAPKWLFPCLFLILASCQQQPQEVTLVIDHVNTIDAVQGLAQDMTVVIRGNEIVAYGKSGTVEIPSWAKVVDGQGKYLIPGLWDAHVHLTFDADISPAMYRLFLANGITSVRDTGGLIHLVAPMKAEAEANPTHTPRVKMAGPLIDGPPRVYDGSTPFRPEISVGVNDEAGARAMVDYLDSMGVDLIKAYEMLSPELFRAVVDQASKHGLPVTGHIPLSMDVISASSTGLASMEHMRNVEMSCVDHPADWLERRRHMLAAGANQAGGVLRSSLHQAQRYDALQVQDSMNTQAVLQALKENNTWQCPTLTIVAARENQVYARPEWRENYQHLPPKVKDAWTENSTRMAEQQTDPNALSYAEWGYNMVNKMNQAEIGIMAGTDCPIFFLTPGFSLHEELRLLVKAGLTPAEALESATLRPAQYFGMEDQLGTIGTGKLADLVLLNENPLEDISHTEDIDCVIRDGYLHDRNALNAMLRPAGE
ncbi:MAG: amidohydrolase family protein [Bacteroidota bacterium]